MVVAFLDVYGLWMGNWWMGNWGNHQFQDERCAKTTNDERVGPSGTRVEYSYISVEGAQRITT